MGGSVTWVDCMCLVGLDGGLELQQVWAGALWVLCPAAALLVAAYGAGGSEAPHRAGSALAGLPEPMQVQAQFVSVHSCCLGGPAGSPESMCSHRQGSHLLGTSVAGVSQWSLGLLRWQAS